MRRHVLTLLLCLGSIFTFNAGNAQSTLIHYWHFNNFTSTMYIPNIYSIDADYSILDTSKARIWYKEMSGVSAAYSTYEDPYPTVPADVDAVNLRMGQPGGTALRPRNPSDSMYLLFYLPTNNFQNIVLKYGTESSSVAHGQLHQFFDYSTDSGATWRTSGLSEPYDSAWLVFNLVTVSFSDPLVNNNPKFVFRIHWDLPNDTMLSGNNRFDNVTLEGDSITAAITTTAAAYGPFCNGSTSLISVAYTTAGIITGSYFVQLSNPDGSFPASASANIIGTGASSPILAAIPAGTISGALYRVRVINTAPVTYGSDNGTNIIVNGPPTAYSVTGGGSYCAGGTGVPIGLSNSQTGVSYQLYRGGGTPVGGTVPGLGGTISFGPQTTAGIYTVRGYYTATAACVNSMAGSVTVTVNPAPGAISGPAALCPTATISLSDAPAGGAWTSGTTATATVGSTGIVTGVATGTATINYTLSDGCAANLVVTVSAGPGPVSGPATVCENTIASFSDGVSGGLWTSSGTSAATVGSLTGSVTGVSVGPTTLTYSLGGSACSVTKTITVNASPAALSGAVNICIGATASLTDGPAGGAWSSTATTVVTVSGTGVVSGAGMGTATISYTLAGCAATTIATVNPTPAPAGGLSTVCVGSSITLINSVSGGSWSSTSTCVSVNSSSGGVTGLSAGAAVITYAIGTCTATKTITVNPLPVLTGASGVCVGSTITLTPSITGGIWSPASGGNATVGAAGIVSGITPGTAVITYTLPTGCLISRTVTVNTIPTAITGTLHTCVGATTALGDGAGGGTWSISSASVATVVLLTGVVTGITPGPATVTYSLGTGCTVFATVIVNPLPSLVAGVAHVCAGLTTTLSDLTTSGAWSSANTAIATVDASGTVSGIVAGTGIINYTISTGCIATANLTVNPLPDSISVAGYVCIGINTGFIDPSGGGKWSSNNTALATIDSVSGLATGIAAGLPVITYTLPTGCIATIATSVNSIAPTITGPTHVCEGTLTTLGDPLTGGTWSSGNSAIATVIPGTGTVWGVSAGTVMISYTQALFVCPAATTVTVNPLPAPISGTPQVCVASAATLSDTGGGTWSSSVPFFANIGSATGIVSGSSAGNTTIIYTLPTGCKITAIETVNALPSPIIGTAYTCQGYTSALSDFTGGGIWSSTNTAITPVSTSGVVSGLSPGTDTISYTMATGCAVSLPFSVIKVPAITGTGNICGYGDTLHIVDSMTGGEWSSTLVTVSAAGLVTSYAAGLATITYTLPTGCSADTTLTVNPLPGAIAGDQRLCAGLTTALTDSTPGGDWSSANSSIASVAAGTDIVTGASAGVVTITYTTATGCIATATVTVNALPADISGSAVVCAGASTDYIDAGGGTWSSSNGTIAIAGLTTGIITGESAGVATITYTQGASCTATKTISVNPAPVPYPVTGGGNYCAGGTGVDVTLSMSAIGTTYQLYDGGFPVGTAISGTDSSLDFGLQVLPGAYTIVALNTATSCENTMLGSAAVGINPLPAAYMVTGGGGYCTGGTGLHIGLASSATGIRYQLYNGLAATGPAITGTGALLDFGAQPAIGVYKVIAMNTTTTCSNQMMDSAVISINPLITPSVSVTSSLGNPLCAGSNTTFTATAVNGGTSPVYQWKINGVDAGAGGSTYSYAPANADVVLAKLTSNAACAAPDTAVNTITMAVDPVVMPTIIVTAQPGLNISDGQSDTLSALVTNGGSLPTYLWKVNGVVTGITTATYISNAFSNGDVVACTVTSSGVCSGQTATCSVTIAVMGNAGIKPVAQAAGNITISPNPNKGAFTIRGFIGTQGAGETVSLELTDMLGQVIYQDRLSAKNGEINKEILLNNSPSAGLRMTTSGTYILSLHSATVNRVFHIVIER